MSGSNLLNFRTSRKEEYKELMDGIGVPASKPLRAVVDYIVDHPETVSGLEEGSAEEEVERLLEKGLEGENFGMPDPDYGELVETTGDYFLALSGGDYNRAMRLGQDIKDLDEQVGNYLARVTVYMEEEMDTLFKN